MKPGGGVAAAQGPDAPPAAADGYWSAGAASAAVAGVAVALDGLLAVDLAVPGTGELLDVLRGVERECRRLAGVSVAIIGQIQQRGLAAPAGASSTSALVRQVITIGRDESSRRVRLAAGICGSVGLSGAVVAPRFPVVAAAVADGGVAVRQAGLICATVDGFPARVGQGLRDAAEQFLVGQARVLDPKTLEQVAREVALLADPDGTPDDRDAQERVQFHLGRRREDGLTRCWGLLDDVTAEALRTAFGAMCSPSAERNRTGRPDPQPPETPATPGGASDEGDTAPGDAGDLTGEAGRDTSRPADLDDDLYDDSDDVEAVPLPADTEPTVAAGGDDAAYPMPADEDAGGEPAEPAAGPDEDGRRQGDQPEWPGGGANDGEGEDEDLNVEGAAGRPPDPPAGSDDADAAPVTDTGAAERRPESCSDSDLGSDLASARGGVDQDPVPGPVWRPPRLPYEWAPLGSVATDYPPPPPHRDPGMGAPGGGQATATAARDAAAGATPDVGATPDPDPDLDVGGGVTAEPERPPDRRSAGTRRAQALGIMITRFLNLGEAPSQGGERPHIVVTIDEQSLRDRTRPGRLGYGDRIPVNQVRMLACDARIIPAVLAGPSEILDVGRSMRTFTAACRTAVLLRDVGCLFPGCDTPGRWAEFHHIRHWADGGPSDVDNAALLCRRHHGLIHLGQWQVRLAADRLPEIVPPITHDLEQRPLRNTLHRPPTFHWPQAG